MDRQNSTEKIKKRSRRRYYSSHKSYVRMRANRRRQKKILLTVFLLVVALTCGIVTAAYFDTDVYQSKKEFKEYANQQLEAKQLFKVTDQTRTDYEYGTPISYAVDYDVYDNEKVTVFRDNQIASIKKTFTETKQQEEGEREKEYGNRIGYKPLAHALLISSEIYESDNGVISLVIYENINDEIDREMQNVSNHINTYQFSVKTGDAMVPVQIFNENYRTACAAYFTDYFQKNYKKEQLAKDWESYLTSAETNFNKFAVTDLGVTFYFDEGTVLKKANGIVSAGMTREDMEGHLRTELIERYIDPAKPMVALTYDDGPGGESEARILDCLEANNAVATFFYQGYRVKSGTDKIQKARAIGCELGNHTWNHPVLTKLDKDDLKKQFVNTNKAIHDTCGAYPTVFRPSYGATNDKVNKASGLPVIMWTLDTRDWESKDAKKIVKKVQKSKNLDGKIILLHSIHGFTAEATETLVPWLKAQGYQLVTVTELITYKTGKPPQAGKVYK